MEPNIPSLLSSMQTHGADEERAPEVEKKGDVSGFPLRTMKTDVAEVIKNQNESVVSIAIAEEKKRAEERAQVATQNKEVATKGEIPRVPNRRGRLVIVVVLFMVAAALAAGVYFLSPLLSSLALPSIPKSLSLPSFGNPPEEEARPFVPVTLLLAPALLPVQSEKRIEVVGNAEGVFGHVLAERTAALEQGTVKNIYLFEKETTEDGLEEERVLSAPRLFALAGVRIAGSLARALENDMMVGLWGGAEPVPFIVLKVSRYEMALVGMIEQEKELPFLVDAIFNARFEEREGETPVFRDVLVEGRDARIAEFGGQTIAYSFANQETIIIAGSEEVLRALVVYATGK